MQARSYAEAWLASISCFTLATARVLPTSADANPGSLDADTHQHLNLLDHGHSMIQMDTLDNPINTSSLLAPNQVFAIQLTTCIIAGISLVSVSLVCYWFCRMRKVFRHKLIMGLMIADLVRSFWLFIFPIVTFAKGTVDTNSPFCQISGFFTQMGFEGADFAVLCIAIHTALQVFKPQGQLLGQGGLYRSRRWVYAAMTITPPVLAALAFIHHGVGYLSQGAICSLPIRPFWYRLATSWVPRYVIMIVIASIYVAIYVHAEHQFTDSKYFRGRLRKARNVDGGDKSACGIKKPKLLNPSKKSTKNDANAAAGKPGRRSTDASAPIDRKLSTGSTLIADVDRRESMAAVLMPEASHRGEKAGERKAKDIDVPEGKKPKIKRPQHLRAAWSTSSDVRPKMPTSASDMMTKKRNAIRRQLRLLFIYPVVFFVLWLIPFVYNVMNYQQRFAQHPNFVILLLAFLSQAAMGTADFVVFSLREKPWRHIPGSDGSILGSFTFWKHVGTNASVPEPVERDTGYSSRGGHTSPRMTAQPATDLSYTQGSSMCIQDALDLLDSDGEPQPQTARLEPVRDEECAEKQDEVDRRTGQAVDRAASWDFAGSPTWPALSEPMATNLDREPKSIS